ncbi:MAG: DUF1559 domain-containing protein, partial [Thermoguttaceae bacterium]|nr:DUF1559 domain-containing protein [Thermoguttaceae bacterium]
MDRLRQTVKSDVWIILLDAIAVNISYLAALVARFYINNDVVPGQVFDGLSNSMMFFECAGRPCKYLRNGRRGNPKETPTEPLYNSEWADPGSGFVIDGINVTDTGNFMNNCNNNEIFSLHPGGANFLYGDGSVHFHSENIDPELFAAHFTCAAGD